MAYHLADPEADSDIGSAPEVAEVADWRAGWFSVALPDLSRSPRWQGDTDRKQVYATRTMWAVFHRECRLCCGISPRQLPSFSSQPPSLYQERRQTDCLRCRKDSSQSRSHNRIGRYRLVVQACALAMCEQKSGDLPQPTTLGGSLIAVSNILSSVCD